MDDNFLPKWMNKCCEHIRIPRRLIECFKNIKIPNWAQPLLKYLNGRFSLVDYIQVFCVSLIIIAGWIVAYTHFEEKVNSNSQPFRILILYVTAKIFGILLKIIKIPSVIGMIGAGILLRNIGYMQLYKLCLSFLIYVRQLTMIVLIVPQVLSLDLKTLKSLKMKGNIFIAIPPISEYVVTFFLSFYLLKLSFWWALLLVSIVGQSGLDVIIPCFLELEKRGYGNKTDILTFMSNIFIIQNIFGSILLFSFAFGNIFISDSFFGIFEGPGDMLIGLVYGILFGFLLWYIPHNNDWYVVTLRTVLLMGASIITCLIFQDIKMEGATITAIIIMSFIANIRWKKQGWQRHNPVRENFKIMRIVLEPLSFALLGLDIKFDTLNIYDLLNALIVIVLVLKIKILISVLSAKLLKFNWKESIFIAISWMAKGAPQAVLSPIAICYLRSMGITEIGQAVTIITVSVLLIMISSFISNVLLLTLGPKLLTKHVIPLKDLENSQAALAVIPDYVYMKKIRRLLADIQKN